MNALLVSTVCSIAVLLTANYVQGAAYAYPYYRETTTTTSTTTTPIPTLPPWELAATSDIPAPITNPSFCQGTTPCGWAVYTPFTREIEYFTHNVCICPTDKSCLRADDELAISAYIYKCGPKTATTENIPIHY